MIHARPNAFSGQRKLAWAALIFATSGVASALDATIAGSADIDITRFVFAPKEVTVAPGTRVRWVNRDEVPHTVTSAQGQAKLLASKALDTDDHYEATFAEEGDYSYFCAVHPFMTGVVHVRKR